MSQPQPVISIRGDHVAIGPLRRDLIPLYHAWISNLETTQYTMMAGAVLTLDEELTWYERVIREDSSQTFTIYALPDYQPIGTINLHQISLRNRTACMGIMIGEPDRRGQGLGSEAVQLVVDYGFNALNLHSIWLTTYEFNIAGRKAYARAGFREIGRRRQCRFHAGRFWDEIHMDILASEFTGSRLETVLLAPEELEQRARAANQAVNP
jgi:RimJ/RimL family protein N-acetyltransferase